MEAEEEEGEMTTTEEETDTGNDIDFDNGHDDNLDIADAPPVHTIAEGHHLLVQDTDTDLDPEATLHVSIQQAIMIIFSESKTIILFILPILLNSRSLLLRWAGGNVFLQIIFVNYFSLNSHFAVSTTKFSH